MKSDGFGVMYIVTTHKSRIYLKAAIESAKSVKKYSPALRVHFYSDKEGLAFIKGIEHSPVDSATLIENPHYRSKVDYIARSPFDRTLYLDSDTRVVADISEMFDLLDRFDCALAHAHNRNHSRTSQVWNTPIPASFPQLNGGVILYKNNEGVNAFLNKWAQSFHEAGFKKDQVTLRELLWLSDLRLATLPPEYNIRNRKYLKIWQDKEAEPKILHMAKFHDREGLPGVRTVLASVLNRILSGKKVI
jgi:hypothetical protein